jgi:hypothetical protein
VPFFAAPAPRSIIADASFESNPIPNRRCLMEFAMFFELPVPKPWTPGKKARREMNFGSQSLGGRC